MVLAQPFAPDDFSKMSIGVVAKRQVVRCDAYFAARSLGISGFKIQAAFAVVIQCARILIPRAPVFKRNRNFKAYASASFLYGTAGHWAPILASIRLTIMKVKLRPFGQLSKTNFSIDELFASSLNVRVRPANRLTH